MATYEFVTLDVFTDQRFGGNPLAVLTDAQGLSEGAMQSIAAEFNLSETVFVLPPADPKHHARLRIFTPRAELPFAGHPNVGAGYALAGRLRRGEDHLVFEEAAGLVRVTPQRDKAGEVRGASIAAPQSLQIGLEMPVDRLAACLGIAEEDILTEAHDPLVMSVGTPFVVAELADNGALARAHPDTAAIRRAAAEVADVAGGIQVYVRQGGDALRLRTRVFAPLHGIVEDPATGSANAALAALLTSLAPGDDVDLAYDIEQGVELGRPSRLYAQARKMAEGPVTARVAGDCVPVAEGRIQV